jgi:chloramphenicol 3-O phosphotransferase
MSQAQIILLNGVSSSGKSSIARALQTMLPVPSLHACIDDYLAGYDLERWTSSEELRQAWPRIIRGFHAAAAAVAREGVVVIVDDVLEPDPPWGEHLLRSFAGLDVLLVGVHCPLDELERRERDRGDRPAGRARLQFAQVHADVVYDIEVNTAELSPEACAARIVGYCRTEGRRPAMDRLRDAYLRDHGWQAP